METIFNIISLTLFLGLIFSPIIIIWRLNRLNVRYKFIIYLTICVLTTATIALTFGWWTDYSDNKLLEHYGYNFDAMNETERFANVPIDNMERVKSLETSIMGIGWQLKVMISYVFYLPYLLIVYLVNYFRVTKNKQN
jgi:hypothetical protein